MDHIEMSGLYISAIVYYGILDGKLKQNVQLVFPMLRTIPNDTHASLIHEISNSELAPIKIDGKIAIEEPNIFHIKGILSYQSETIEGIRIKHQLYPSTDQ